VGKDEHYWAAAAAAAGGGGAGAAAVGQRHHNRPPQPPGVHPNPPSKFLHATMNSTALGTSSASTLPRMLQASSAQ